jgi:hypothetical protein
MPQPISRSKALMRATVLENPWVQSCPAISPATGHSPQAEFLLDPHYEILYGGAAGGGKSEAMLMAAAQYVDVPGYAALILRRTYPQLSQPGGLIPRSHEWWENTPASWNEQKKQWTFPSGATVSFGHLQHEDDKYDYQSGEYQFVGFEELTQFSESQFLYLFSRVRRTTDSDVPVRVRATSNPGGVGHAWVKSRFIDTTDPDRRFIPAKLEDNPYLDLEEYERGLSQLDSVTRRQLRDGDWSVSYEGGMWSRKLIADNRVYKAPDLDRIVIPIDPAVTSKASSDETGMIPMGRAGDTCYVLLDCSLKATPDVWARKAVEVYHGLGADRIVGEVNNGGDLIETVIRTVDKTVSYKAVHATRGKTIRAEPVLALCEQGRVKFVGEFPELEDQLCTYRPGEPSPDRMDSFVWGVTELMLEREIDFAF